MGLYCITNFKFIHPHDQICPCQDCCLLSGRLVRAGVVGLTLEFYSASLITAQHLRFTFILLHSCVEEDEDLLMLLLSTGAPSPPRRPFRPDDSDGRTRASRAAVVSPVPTFPPLPSSLPHLADLTRHPLPRPPPFCPPSLSSSKGRSTTEIRRTFRIIPAGRELYVPTTRPTPTATHPQPHPLPRVPDPTLNCVRGAVELHSGDDS